MDGGRRSQAERRSVAERRVLDAAIRVIAAEGIGGTSLAEIGAAAGYSRGIATHYFGTKEKLLVRVLDNVATAFVEALATADFQEADGLARVTLLAGLMLRRTVANPELGRALQIMRAQSLIAPPALHKAIEAANGASARIVKEMLCSARAAGQIRADVDPDAVALFIVGALRGMIGQHLADPRSIDLEAAGRAFCEMLEAALMLHPGSRINNQSC